MEIYECKLEDIKKYNPLFFKQTWFSKDREDFFDDFKKDGTAAIKKWTSEAKENEISFKRKIYNIFPTYIRHIILGK